ncbi:MAG: sarcosine oxidase subunit alpha family protein [Pseudomonadota bacterium]
MSGYRLDAGGQIDRNAKLSFRWDGKSLSGFEGDTLASALLANGQSLVARSFKYHRPRGIMTAGSEEPNALVTLGEGAATTPNTKATVVPLRDGLVAHSQNWRGSLKWDLMSLNDVLSPVLSAGFYYKTFMWPKSFWERLYEPAIRASAGLGALSGSVDPDSYANGFKHADLLVIGAGPAGLMAALTAGRAGLRVIVADEDTRLGGRLNAETLEIAGAPGHQWATEAAAELAALPNVTVMPQSTVFGVYDGGQYGILERGTAQVRATFWRVRARHAVLASGATERPIAFPGNDRPGVMMAGAVRTYLNRFAVATGQQVALFGNNDSLARTARDLRAAGVDVVVELDSRAGASVIGTNGRQGLRQIMTGDGTWREADCLAISGGWSPNVHLMCHHRGRPVWREDIAAFVPGPDLPPGMLCAGAVTGAGSLSAALREGAAAAVKVAEAHGTTARTEVPQAEDEPTAIAAFWHVSGAKGRAFVDFQHDVTTKDIIQAKTEGFEAVEHLKRYTTLGMATDQGKSSNVLGLALMAEARGVPIADAGTTIFRPPYTPVPIGAFAGPHRGPQFRPVRRTPSEPWAKEQGAVFIEAGQWMRAQYFPRAGEQSWQETVAREVTTTRSSVGVCDVSTLGKIEVQGRDAAAYLNFVYCNGFAKLAVGRTRYGLMLREDGFAYDDGTCARLSEHHYIVTTTTAKAGEVYRHMEFVRQCLCPEMDVHLISTTDGWAQYSVAGPQSRSLLSRLIDEDISDTAYPYMACGAVTVCGTAGRLFRISFSGELAYEVAVPARYGDALIRALMAEAQSFDGTAYGTEALGVMRVEKGHPAGAELNGQTTAADLGLGRMVSSKKDSIGAVASRRPALLAEDRAQLVGLVPEDKSKSLRAGAHLLATDAAAEMGQDQGWISSAVHSPTLGHDIALAFLKGGANRAGDRIRAWDGLRGRDILVDVVSPHFYDPEGARLRT